MGQKVELACIIDDDKIYVNLVKKIIEIKKLSENLLIYKNGKEAPESSLIAWRRAGGRPQSRPSS